MEPENKNAEEDGNKVLESTTIYPHSVTISADYVYAKEVYDEFFADSKFLVYLSIYSKKPKSDYIIELAVIDIMERTDGTHKIFCCETLDGDEYKNFINSMFIIFKPFKRHVLNFKKDKSYSMLEYLEIVKVWVEGNRGSLEKLQ